MTGTQLLELSLLLPRVHVSSKLGLKAEPDSPIQHTGVPSSLCTATPKTQPLTVISAITREPGGNTDMAAV